VDLVLLERVRDELLDEAEALGAHRTLIWHALVRLELVLLQLVLPRVGQIAEVARVRLLAGVRAHVAFEMDWRRKAPRAVGARVALLRRTANVLLVDVAAQAARMRKRGCAVLALQHVLLEVHVHVIAQHALVHERDAAEVAGEAALRGDVQPPMVVERLPRLELPCADIAHGGHLLFVLRRFVLAQKLLAGELAPAHAALPSANRASSPASDKLRLSQALWGASGWAEGLGWVGEWMDGHQP